MGPSIVVLLSYLDIILKPRTAPSTAILITPACIYPWDKRCRNLQYSISVGQDEEDVCRFTSISFTFDAGEVSYQLYHNPMLPWIMPQQAQKVLGETVHHPGTSSGEGRSEEEEEENENYDQSNRQNIGIGITDCVFTSTVCQYSKDPQNKSS